jgi:hypothetical protein
MLARGYNGQMRILTPPALSWQAWALGAIPLVILGLIEWAAVSWWS